ncbi:MAG: parvulin peptidyl-prolyl isomerase [Candidatus Cloacimonetes bacterium]|jgi:peptidyl-prolyl cis-trans isomerase C|nr:parvulin peptidyl-prolyl isomerase [Candidatus Cloacimonadota bacterium]
MQQVAKVFDLYINEDEVLLESENWPQQEEFQPLAHAFSQVLDRYLLFYKAREAGVNITEEEFDEELMLTLEDMDEAPQSEQQTRVMENRVRQRVMIRKYVHQITELAVDVTDEELLALYQDQEESFYSPESVRASHILFRADKPEAEAKAREIRAKIHNAEDFNNICPNLSDCPSGARKGDLNWFFRGRVIKEIEDVAFALEPGQVSEAFRSPHGWHIMLVTDKKGREKLSFEEIKDSLKTQLIQLKKEFILIRHVKDLRQELSSGIQILDSRFSLSQE